MQWERQEWHCWPETEKKEREQREKSKMARESMDCWPRRGDNRAKVEFEKWMKCKERMDAFLNPAHARVFPAKHRGKHFGKNDHCEK